MSLPTSDTTLGPTRPSGVGSDRGRSRRSSWTFGSTAHCLGSGKRRFGAPALYLLLVACGRGDGDEVAGREPIQCVLPGQSDFKPICSVERSASPDGMVVTARAPDGGFHRLLIVKDGRGVIAADGAEQVVVKPAGQDGIDVEAGGTVYRLPARIVP